MRRTLALRREPLAPLTSDEMAAVAGASHLCLTPFCVVIEVTDGCLSLERCPTVPVFDCVNQTLLCS